MVFKSVSVFIVIFIIIGGSFLLLHYYMDAEGRNAEKHSAHQVPSKQVSVVKQTEAQRAEVKDKEKKNLEAVKKTQQKQAVIASARLPAAKKLTVPFVSQLPELPNGCEITSLTMLLQSAGINVTKMTLAEQVKKVPYQSDGYMGNPNQGFVGNMYHGNRNNPGLAVYHGPVANLARTYLGNRVIDLSGSSWTSVEQQIASGHPVWVITSINSQPVPAGSWHPWRTRSGIIQITFMEHSVLVTGYDKTHVYFNNPLAAQSGSKALKKNFITAWHQFGNQAISYRGQPLEKKDDDDD
ncbi:C39 family peptidase [Sporolactobacillus spathodeae]|uniref:Uncharacterized protein YvpB n=1 Tax=Sporolactobacillus spathodeae TaxID=1465502 RepID=A0ABS2Q850_9BACL|nr:C39 family peptidase [Sporolactobacillus spathodeae]MBM7657615.1 uncharacterized protein YvpB [Sporolactobacillus spathodeae]